MNMFWAPKKSNKKIVQFQKYNIEKKENGKKVWKTKENEKQIELFGHQKSSKSTDFLGDKKNKNGTFWEKKKFKKFRDFFEKN